MFKGLVESDIGTHPCPLPGGEILEPCLLNQENVHKIPSWEGKGWVNLLSQK
jgi:hypothetical protein